MNRKTTIKDIAKELNISYAMVSRALNNSGFVKQEKKEKIIQKAKDLGYKPNHTAKQLRNGKSNTIGLIVPRINRVYFSNVIHGVETFAKSRGFHVIIYQSNESATEEMNGLNTLIENNVAGIIMSLSSETSNFSKHNEIIRQGTALVMFDRISDSISSNKVINDNFQGAYNTVSHLIEQGYRQIVHFAGPLHLNVYKDRLEGYKKALTDKGLTVDEDLIFENVLTKNNAQIQAENLYQSNMAFDAIFAASDYSALGAFTHFQQKGIKIPEEIGIAGFANEPFTELMGITSVEQHSIEIGKSAARLLFEEIESENPESSKKEIRVKTELHVRHSSLKIIKTK